MKARIFLNFRIALGKPEAYHNKLYNYFYKSLKVNSSIAKQYLDYFPFFNIFPMKTEKYGIIL